MDIPKTLDEITPEWLTGALRAGGSLGTDRVDSVSFEPVGEGSGLAGAMVRLVIDYSGRPSSAPATVIAKFPTANEQVRDFLVKLGVYECETRFYLELGG